MSIVTTSTQTIMQRYRIRRFIREIHSRNDLDNLVEYVLSSQLGSNAIDILFKTFNCPLLKYSRLNKGALVLQKYPQRGCWSPESVRHGCQFEADGQYIPKGAFLGVDRQVIFFLTATLII